MATFHQVQTDPYSLSGAGAVIGATSIILQSFQTIDGVNLAMTDFGTIGYGTLDPGNGSLEEQISFSGVVQNSNGTATLTGVKTVLFVSPYTETSGLAKTHAGSTPFVISNTAGFYNQFPAKVNDETITGQWTFTVTPITPPAVSLASTTVAGIVQEATIAQIRARTQTGSTGAELFPNTATLPNVLIQDYVADTGAANAYAIAPTPAIVAYVVGQEFSFKVLNTNTGTSTLSVNGLATKTITNTDGTILTAGNLTVGQIAKVEYDGTNFQLISSLPTQTVGKMPFTAGETINGATIPVPVYQDTGTGKFLACDANDVTKYQFVGFAISNSTDANPITIQTTGIVSGFSGLSVGVRYYVQDVVGTIGATPGTQAILVGTAVSATQLLIMSSPQIASGTVAIGTATTTTTITLGYRPKVIRLSATCGGGTGVAALWSMAWGSFANGLLKGIYSWGSGTTQTEGTGMVIADAGSTPASNYMTVTISNITTTSFDLVYTETGTYTRGGDILWEAEGYL